MAQTRTTYVYGRNPVLEWLLADLPVQAILLARETETHLDQHIKKQIEKRAAPVQRLSKQELQIKTGSADHQGIAALVQLPAYVSVEELIDSAAAKGEPMLIVILDQVQDPHNLGAILRSAEGAGVHGVILPKDNSAELTPAAFKASAGAAALVPIARVTNLVRAMEMLKEQGLWLVGTDDQAAEIYYKRDLCGPIGIVMGSEGKGLRRLVAETCDFMVRIPMNGRINSLNVSVASALLFFEVRRQRAGRVDGSSAH
jgi:23S rRNA (guanosine2251-2'-O)-methyltransferase